jgi:tetratricopeptide (TPR) repeat protein
MRKRSVIIGLGLVLSFVFIQISSKLNAQDVSIPKYGKDSVQCVKDLSIYAEFYKQWKKSKYTNEVINDVIEPWKSAYNNCPRSTKNLYIHGEKIYKKFYIKNAKDKTQKNKYIDSLMALYDKRIKYFGKKGKILDKKGVDLYKYRPSAYEQVYQILKESVELRNDKASSTSLIYYFRTAEKLVEANKLDVSELVAIFDKSMKICDANIEKMAAKPKKKATWETTKANLELSFEPWGTCDVLVPMFQKKFDARPDDVDLLKKITKTLDKKDCSDSPLFFAATEKLNALEPSAKTSYLMGRMMMGKKKDYSGAIKYFKQAIDLYDNDEDKEPAYIMAAVCYSQLKQYSSARAFAQKALAINPKNGKAYIIIGDAYASSNSSCKSKDLPAGAAYWAAVDQYAKAKAVDPSVASMASNKIRGLKPHFPTKEKIFFLGLEPGKKVTIGCWMNVSTTVRTSD